jgi:hypothetical protein
MPNSERLNAMVAARRQMARCIDRFDALVYNPHDHSFMERGLDPLVLETMRTLRRFYVLHSGLDSHIP